MTQQVEIDATSQWEEDATPKREEPLQKKRRSSPFSAIAAWLTRRRRSLSVGLAWNRDRSQSESSDASTNLTSNEYGQALRAESGKNILELSANLNLFPSSGLPLPDVRRTIAKPISRPSWKKVESEFPFNSQQLLKRISDFYDHNFECSLHTNDLKQESSSITTSFSGKETPSINLFDYLCRLAKYVNYYHCESDFSPESTGIRAIIGATVFINRICKKNSDLVITMRNVHRLFLIGTLLAEKIMEDESVNNVFFSKVGGLSLTVMNSLETEFCKFIGFELSLSDKDILFAYSCFDDDYYSAASGECQG